MGAFVLVLLGRVLAGSGRRRRIFWLVGLAQRARDLDRVGRTLFTTDVRGLTWGTPALAGDRIYAGTAGQKDVLVAHRPGVCALDRRTGALLWRRELPMGDARMAGFASSLAVAGGMLVGATVDGTVLGIPLDA